MSNYNVDNGIILDLHSLSVFWTSLPIISAYSHWINGFIDVKKEDLDRWILNDFNDFRNKLLVFRD
jgi:hypothetical protein